MSQLVMKRVSKEYASGVLAVDDFSLTVEANEFLTLLGGSGCGKTTILRLIAGLESLTSGSIELEGVVIDSLRPKDRGVAMVFQSYALFPHLSVYNNIRIGALFSHLDRVEERKAVEGIAEIMGIGTLLNRRPSTLSGGQRQRVALARALIKKPKLLLLDEPLASLDAKLRTEMQTELLRIKREFNTTIIYVTHDQTEAMTMSDRIVVMEGGRISQVGTPKEIYHHPKNRFVASFIGSPKISFISIEGEGEWGIRAENVHYFGHSEPDMAKYLPIEVRVELIEERGNESIIHGVTQGSSELRGRIYQSHDIKLGQNITLYIDRAKIHQF